MRGEGRGGIQTINTKKSNAKYRICGRFPEQFWPFYPKYVEGGRGGGRGVGGGECYSRFFGAPARSAAYVLCAFLLARSPVSFHRSVAAAGGELSGGQQAGAAGAVGCPPVKGTVLVSRVLV